MEQLKKLLGLAQQHYEKVVLGLALAALGLAGLMLAAQKEGKSGFGQIRVGRERTQDHILYQPGLERLLGGLAKRHQWVQVDFRKGHLHNLFGPVKWQMRPDHTLLKIELGTEVGPRP